MFNKLNTFRLSSLIVMLLMDFMIFITSNRIGSAAPTTVTVTAPGAAGVVLEEVDDYATHVLGDPWDMNEASDLTRYRNASQESGLVNSIFSGGIYSAQMTIGQGGEKITLLKAGAPNHTSLRIGKIGYHFPIDADKYRYLTFRLYKSCTPCNSGLIEWYSEDTYTDAVKGISNGYKYSVSPAVGWHIVTIDLKTIGIQRGQKEWSGTIRDLGIHPFSGTDAAGATVKLDWARLTVEDPRTSRPYTITWTNGSGSYDIYASPDDKVLDGDGNDILLASGVNGDAGSYLIQTGVLPSGSYYIGIKNGGDIVWSPGSLTLNAPPQVVISKPSKTSGEEYSASVLGDAWDMDQNNDLNDNLPFGWETCVSNPAFTAGIYSAVLTGCANDTVTTDARFVLGYMDSPAAFDPTIDTHKFRYLSFHYKLDGEQDVGHGWVARFGWWQHGADGLTSEADVMSRDIVLEEGWNTYKLDLWADDIVDEAHPVQRSWLDSAPNRLRFDPAELYLNLLPKGIELDWIKLTAIDEVKQGGSFPIEYEVSDTDAVALTFYYDVDTNPDNGRSLIGTDDVLSASTTELVAPQNTTTETGDYFVFLPIILNNYYPCEGNCFRWDTSSVANGTYFICIESEDAYNSTYQCSEAPVIVHP